VYVLRIWINPKLTVFTWWWRWICLPTLCKVQVLSPIGIHLIAVKILKFNHPIFFCFWHKRPQLSMDSSFTRWIDHTQRRTTVSRTRTYLYLTTNNKHNRQTFMPPMGFEPTISVGERPQNQALDRAVTGI